MSKRFENLAVDKIPLSVQVLRTVRSAILLGSREAANTANHVRFILFQIPSTNRSPGLGGGEVNSLFWGVNRGSKAANRRFKTEIP